MSDATREIAVSDNVSAFCVYHGSFIADADFIEEIGCQWEVVGDRQCCSCP